LEGEAFGVLEATLLGEVESTCSSTSESAALVLNEEETVSIEGEIQRSIGAL
jgi:hypothetical protein